MGDNVIFIQGNEAIVHGAIAAGAKFFGGYPITPSSEIAEHASRLLPLVGGIFIQMEDEMSSLASVEGASAAGLKAFTATSGLGFSLMQEHIGHALMCEIPCVIVVVQRGGPATGLATKPAQGEVMQARWGTNGDHSIIVLAPSSVKECYELTVRAFYFAEKYRTPVIVLSDAAVGKMYEGVILRKPITKEIAPSRIPDCSPIDYRTYRYDPDNIPVLVPMGGDYQVHLCSAVHDEFGISKGTPQNSDKSVRYLTNKIEKHVDDITITKEYWLDDAEIVLVSFGCSCRSARGAAKRLRGQGVKAGVLQLLTLWPFPKKEINKVLRQARLVFVVELNLGQLYNEICRHNSIGTEVISINKVSGELITPAEIIDTIKGVF